MRNSEIIWKKQSPAPNLRLHSGDCVSQAMVKINHIWQSFQAGKDWDGERPPESPVPLACQRLQQAAWLQQRKPRPTSGVLHQQCRHGLSCFLGLPLP